MRIDGGAAGQRGKAAGQAADDDVPGRAPLQADGVDKGIGKRTQQDENRRQMPPIPWFAIAFIVLTGVNSLHIVPEALVVQLRLICTLLLTAAMAALGIDTTFLRMRQAGLRPIILGGTLFLHLIFVGGLFNWLLA